MKTVKTILITLVILLALAVAGMLWILGNFHIIGFRLYPKNAEVLDLRRQDISVSLYEKLAEKMPDTEIRWDVPFQGGKLPWDTEEVSVETLQDKDVQTLCLLKNLKTVTYDGVTILQ